MRCCHPAVTYWILASAQAVRSAPSCADGPMFAQQLSIWPPTCCPRRESYSTLKGLGERVELLQADITALPGRISAGPWDVISCMWTLHQLPDFELLRGALRQIAALRRRSAAAVWISDFQRLRDPTAGPNMLLIANPASPAVLRQDAIASEAAAFTIAELSKELAAAGLQGMHCGHSTPLPYLQAHWMFGARGKMIALRGTRDAQLDGRARRESALLRWGFTAKPF
jgi:tRNA (cmo5U34)-methyltransferase